MTIYQNSGTSIYYELSGQGFPLLLFSPGGMDATIHFWQRTAFNPMAIFSEHFRVIAFDQRNAGGSNGPVGIGDPWAEYFKDHVGLLNHLGIDKCLVLGCCIGASYALRMMRDAPDRIVAAVLEQPVGIDEGNRRVMPNSWQSWADGLLERRADLDRATLEAFGKRMWAGDFVLSVSREDVRVCNIPMLVLPGIDLHHPPAIGHEIAELAPDAELLTPWKEPADLVPATVRRIREFLLGHVPG